MVIELKRFLYVKPLKKEQRWFPFILSLIQTIIFFQIDFMLYSFEIGLFVAQRRFSSLSFFAHSIVRSSIHFTIFLLAKSVVINHYYIVREKHAREFSFDKFNINWQKWTEKSVEKKRGKAKNWKELKRFISCSFLFWRVYFFFAFLALSEKINQFRC